MSRSDCSRDSADRRPECGCLAARGSTNPQSIPLLNGDQVETPAGRIPRAQTSLTWRDRLGSMKVRMGIGRMRYLVDPGLYAAGTPSPESPVLVSANYKLSFDTLRKELSGLDAWILVLDTKGVNVWCAAGKGTFGTEEIIRRIEMTKLSKVVSHRRLIVPQLGAPGVSAREVEQQSGFRVTYGPIRAADLRAFLEAGMMATPEMRRVLFPLRDRAVLIPLELSLSLRKAIPIAALLFILAGLGPDGYSLGRAIAVGLPAVGFFASAFLVGVALVPLFLPWLPGRAFSVKGAVLGTLLALGIGIASGFHLDSFGGLLSALAWLLIIPTLISFLALNFTGASTYTSLSGVLRETRRALPVHLVFAVTGISLWIAGRFI